ncbi:non-hydrolyzing UDP-N-acetylglucosamine 2-epimerase [Ekhidna sp.]|uniref:non-hydrolyzing UDP-N-acetylglucosamine 2-epimerase n=1 Tax=Ekhidna sp. TaxID=2608089 RepID=UPI003B50A5AF
MIKIVTVVGARPQFIKASVVSKAFENCTEIREITVHTGQHYDQNMSQIFFDQMEIKKPDYNLGINSGSHGSMTGKMLSAIEEVLLNEKPDYVLVYGDTNSTLAGALAAKKQNIKVIHVEAGLRSFNNNMPEEINRILTDRISDLLFYPTDTAAKNLKSEGFPYPETKMVLSGDVMFDATLFYSQKSNDVSTILSDHNLLNTPYVLCTIHRSENTDSKERLDSIVKAINKINDEIKVVLPIHPRTKKQIQSFGIHLNLNPIDPVGYFDMIQLLSKCKLVMTDSGGLQKEAYFFQKPCLTLRDETEWTELVDKGYNILCGASKSRIIENAHQIMGSLPDFEKGIYGNGQAAQIIRNEILSTVENHA